MKHKKTYADMERHPGDMTDFRRPAYSVRHPDIGYHDTQNTSTGQQNVAEYPESEYGTQNMSMAGKLIRAQGEQIRYMSADEYLKDKMGGDADGRIQSSRISGACSRSGGAGGKGL